MPGEAIYAFQKLGLDGAVPRTLLFFDGPIEGGRRIWSLGWRNSKSRRTAANEPVIGLEAQ
jgi:hypothetical protein